MIFFVLVLHFLFYSTASSAYLFICICFTVGCYSNCIGLAERNCQKLANQHISIGLSPLPLNCTVSNCTFGYISIGPSPLPTFKHILMGPSVLCPIVHVPAARQPRCVINKRFHRQKKVLFKNGGGGLKKGKSHSKNKFNIFPP